MTTSRSALRVDGERDFKQFLIDHGWKIESTCGKYEAIRARNENWPKPLLVYKPDRDVEHFTTHGVALWWALMFGNYKREWKVKRQQELRK